ncbi:hypothetical protein ACL2OD_13145 [Enterococcus faecalis]|uniref:hypothetical protein n=1 Tax=Enterococcus faecalis TaxID=1351 RepID=UPI0039A65D6A
MLPSGIFTESSNTDHVLTVDSIPSIGGTLGRTPVAAIWYNKGEVELYLKR